ncbi:MAG: hypothetical protein COA78_25810 [Blastopirellula sp.]|nr:MAG: hypothetical protein COA78_25810 [Blastopirellula sp.]
MPTKNLWGDLSELEIVHTPRTLLEEQAAYLTSATESKIIGVVDVITSGRTFKFDLDIKVPFLNNYEFTILRVTHGISLYPVSISSQLKIENQKCDNEEELEEVLETILSSKEMRDILANLLSLIS